MRGTTPKFTWTIPADAADVNNIRALFAQRGELLFRVEHDRFELDGDKATITLTQEDTLKFSAGEAVDVQLRILTNGGASLVSKVKQIFPGRLLENEVIEWISK